MKVYGESLAGIATCIRVPEARILFDCGVTSDLLLNLYSYNHLFLTHGHLDHTSGILHWLYAKAMRSQGESFIYVPVGYKTKLEALIQANAELQYETVPVDFKIVEIKPSFKINEEYEDNGVLIYKSNNLQYKVSAFETNHTIPSQGYLLEEVHTNNQKTKIKKKLAFTGDTRIMPLWESLIKDLPLLIHECTYFEDVSKEKALLSGHTRFPELLEEYKKWLEVNPDLNLSLCHFSNRYLKDLNTWISKIDPKLNIHLLKKQEDPCKTFSGQKL